ncbi:helix-turn-helix domain-containing protein [Streptococcus iniae]|uniref:helix-turn-helix domain-containing protein n=1 Tax=Streptococcus iniae TaxID=1346 RepID=UPI00035DA2DF|nr:helix-turn-helix domain-containing protein [Streptococcus iniae]ESR10157.1 hypothetical protein IUSA1_03300 [Streptococcus iniae IUSA1]KYJ82923.1 hypothetical protein NA30_01420 [Streptococcus iniae]RLV28621.1 helix-turn-helix domain-containing protein [Streptococcus iniae]RMI76809.1 helix-turn-helix domain-containing protein [Streptococcus iniae]HEK4517179.1 helix-turn-helix domain-containing protein [Streptococcus iniae]
MLSDKLKELRNLNGHTQKEVALFLNLNRVTYTNYERGISEPSILTLKKIASFFDVSIDYLLEYKNNSTDKIKRRTLLLELEKEYDEINQSFEFEIKALLKKIIYLLKTHQLNNNEVSEWLTSFNDQPITYKNNLLLYISEKYKDLDPSLELIEVTYNVKNNRL